jgi:hypothetical protein
VGQNKQKHECQIAQTNKKHQSCLLITFSDDQTLSGWIDANVDEKLVVDSGLYQPAAGHFLLAKLGFVLTVLRTCVRACVRACVRLAKRQKGDKRVRYGCQKVTMALETCSASLSNRRR